MKKVMSIFLGIMMFGLSFNHFISEAKSSINKDNLSIEVGETVRLKVSNAKTKIFWKSNKPLIATVSEKGIVKAKHKGTTKIIAKVGKKKFYCKVVVKNKKINVQNSVFTRKLYSQISRIQFRDYGGVKKIKSKAAIREIYSKLAERKLTKAAKETVAIEGGLWLTIVKKNGKKMNIVVGTQIIVDGVIYYSDNSQVVEEVRKLMDKYGK